MSNTAFAPATAAAPSAPSKAAIHLQRFTRSHDDACDLARRGDVTTGPGRYVTANLMQPRGAQTAIADANLTVNVQPRGFGGPDRDAVDADTTLRIDSVDEGRKRLPLRVQARPIATVPYMGGGRGDADRESALLHSSAARMDRSTATVTEKPFDVFVPLVPHLARHVQNAKNLITEDAAAGWIRGGLSSRTFMRDLQC